MQRSHDVALTLLTFHFLFFFPPFPSRGESMAESERQPSDRMPPSEPARLASERPSRSSGIHVVRMCFSSVRCLISAS